MTQRIKIDSATLQERRSFVVDAGIPGIYNFQVCMGGNGWPTPCEVGIYLDADGRSAIVDWPRPCEPIKVNSKFGEFIVHLDTATEETIAAAQEVEATFHRDD